MSEGYLDQQAWGHGLATKSLDGQVLDVWFPELSLGEAPKSDLQWFPPKELELAAKGDELREIVREVVRVEVELAQPISSTEDAYLRLHLISMLLVRPNSINLEGLIANLPILAFTNFGPMLPEVFERKTLELKASGVSLHSLDKFPATRRAPRSGNDGHARGIRELQRRDPRFLNGRGANLAGCGGR